MNPSQYAELFLTESREHVSAINQWLLELERGADAGEPVSAIFRSVHTVKGMSATMGYTAVAELSHELETLLDRLRREELAISPELVDALFAATDELEAAIEGAVVGAAAADIAPILERLRAFGAAPAEPAPKARGGKRKRSTTAAVAAVPDTPRWTAPAPDGDGLLVRVMLRSDTVLRGVRAFLIVQAVAKLGTITGQQPSVEALQAESFEYDFALRVQTAVEPRALEKAIRAAGDVAEVQLGEDAEHALGSAPLPTPIAPAPAGGAQSAGGAGAAGAGATAAPAGGEAIRQQRHVRIDLRRLDALMNLIGELVITRGRLAQLTAGSGDAALVETVGLASRLIGELQDEILISRMVPVGQIFDRFPRLVRDSARALGKQIDFVVEGKDIELDRSMLDEIGDPIVHLLRNAIDHGIESAADRQKAGKSPSGRLELSASRDRSAIAIRVSDDGKGIDRGRVLAKAQRQGLVDREITQLSDEEMVRLIAQPGFSTAERVTDLSGRGVGIDAVINRVRGLGGSVDIRSEPGAGTSVTLRLPLTLAIVRSLLARVADETYAIPMTHVRETVEVDDSVLTSLQGREVLVLREEVLPVLRMRELVQLPAAPEGALEQAVVLEMSNRRAALVLDELTAQQEIVVKQFDAVRGGLALFGGATILGDGAPALIIDVGSLL